MTMNDLPISRQSSPLEQIIRIPTEQDGNDSNESKVSTPEYSMGNCKRCKCCKKRFHKYGTYLLQRTNDPFCFQLKRGHAHRSHASNIIGVLKELKDDIVDCNQACDSAGKSCVISKRGPATGMKDVYVEQNGKFIKAPKELLENCDFNTREVYLEEIGPGFFTPLDMAIIVEKACSSFSRILLGILAGVALLAFILIIILLNSWEITNIFYYWPFLAKIVEVCQTLIFVMLSICLVSLLDWLDLAHANPQHVVDTLYSRKIFFVIVIYFSAMIVFLLTAPSNDYVIYNMLDNSTVTEQGENEVLEYMYFWKTLTSAYLILCIVGWFVVVSTRNEDLFYIHLLGMKKYEACGAQMTFENQIACQLN